MTVILLISPSSAAFGQLH